MYNSGSPIENYRMLVQWYWREVEFKYYPKKSQPKFAHSQELLLNTSKIDHDLELTSIINTCIVSSSSLDPFCGKDTIVGTK